MSTYPAWAIDEYGLLVIGVLAAVVAAFFYLRIAIAMLTAPDGEAPEPDARRRRVDAWSAIALASCATMTLLVGVVPGTFIHWARDATFML